MADEEAQAELGSGRWPGRPSEESEMTPSRAPMRFPGVHRRTLAPGFSATPRWVASLLVAYQSNGRRSGESEGDAACAE